MANLYYTHITPSYSKAEPIAKYIFKKSKDDQIDINKINFVGCDGTNTNTSLIFGKFNIHYNIHFDNLLYVFQYTYTASFYKMIRIK